MPADDLMRRLYRAVKQHSGMSDRAIVEAGQHGADAGWPGFTYYRDTVRFHDDNEEDVWALACELADEMGAKTVLEFIASLRGAKDVSDADTQKNLLAWLVLEEVGRWLEANPRVGGFATRSVTRARKRGP